MCMKYYMNYLVCFRLCKECHVGFCRQPRDRWEGLTRLSSSCASRSAARRAVACSGCNLVACPATAGGRRHDIVDCDCDCDVEHPPAPARTASRLTKQAEARKHCQLSFKLPTKLLRETRLESAKPSSQAAKLHTLRGRVSDASRVTNVLLVQWLWATSTRF